MGSQVGHGESPSQRSRARNVDTASPNTACSWRATRHSVRHDTFPQPVERPFLSVVSKSVFRLPHTHWTVHFDRMCDSPDIRPAAACLMTVYRPNWSPTFTRLLTEHQRLSASSAVGQTPCPRTEPPRRCRWPSPCRPSRSSRCPNGFRPSCKPYAQQPRS